MLRSPGGSPVFQATRGPTLSVSGVPLWLQVPHRTRPLQIQPRGCLQQNPCGLTHHPLICPPLGHGPGAGRWETEMALNQCLPTPPPPPPPGTTMWAELREPEEHSQAERDRMFQQSGIRTVVPGRRHSKSQGLAVTRKRPLPSGRPALAELRKPKVLRRPLGFLAPGHLPLPEPNIRITVTAASDICSNPIRYH